MSSKPPHPPSDNSSTPPPPPPPPPRGGGRLRKDAADVAPAGGGPAPSDPILKRTIVRPAGIVPDPVDAAYVANRLTTLTHELANLIDGSLRVISLARKSAGNEAPEQIGRHLETVQAAMVQMAEIVRNSMTGLSPGGAEAMKRSLGSSGSLAAAAVHAVNVMRPIAEEQHIELTADIGPELSDVPAGAIYGVIINTVRNAIESVERAGRGQGRILVRAWMEAGRTGRCIGIEITDDGEGPPPPDRRPGRSVFDPGVTAKPGGAGIGLSMCKEVVEQLGGTIDLGARTGHAGGAVLRIRYPAPAPMSDRPIG